MAPMLLLTSSCVLEDGIDDYLNDSNTKGEENNYISIYIRLADDGNSTRAFDGSGDISEGNYIFNDGIAAESAIVNKSGAPCLQLKR